MQANTNRNSNSVFCKLGGIDIVMPRRILTVSQKLAILEESEQTGSIEMTELQQKLQKIQLMDWV